MKFRYYLIFFLTFYTLGVSVKTVDLLFPVFFEGREVLLLPLFAIYLLSGLVLALFITKIRVIALEKYKSESPWKTIFYGSYLLLIVLGSILLTQIGYGLAVAVPAFIAAIIIGDIYLLIKSYRLRPRLTFFYNLVVGFILIVILSVFLLFIISILE